MNKQDKPAENKEARRLSAELKALLEVAESILNETGYEGKALRRARKALAEHNEAVKREQTKQTDRA